MTHAPATGGVEELRVIVVAPRTRTADHPDVLRDRDHAATEALTTAHRRTVGDYRLVDTLEPPTIGGLAAWPADEIGYDFRVDTEPV